MYKQLNHSNHETAYLLGSILLFSFQGCKEKPVTSPNLSSTPNVIYVFPDQMRNHAMGFWREAGFREAVNSREIRCIRLIWTGLRKNLLC